MNTSTCSTTIAVGKADMTAKNIQIHLGRLRSCRNNLLRYEGMLGEPEKCACTVEMAASLLLSDVSKKHVQFLFLPQCEKRAFITHAIQQRNPGNEQRCHTSDSPNFTALCNTCFFNYHGVARSTYYKMLVRIEKGQQNFVRKQRATPVGVDEKRFLILGWLDSHARASGERMPNKNGEIQLAEYKWKHVWQRCMRELGEQMAALRLEKAQQLLYAPGPIVVEPGSVAAPSTHSPAGSGNDTAVPSQVSTLLGNGSMALPVAATNSGVRVLSAQPIAVSPVDDGFHADEKKDDVNQGAEMNDQKSDQPNLEPGGIDRVPEAQPETVFPMTYEYNEFMRLVHQLPYLKIRKYKCLGKCSECLSLEKEIRESKGLDHQMWVARHARHIQWQERERSKKSHHEERAFSRETKRSMVIEIDAMDHSKTSMPKAARKDKKLDGVPLMHTHLTGVIQHTLGKKKFMGYLWQDKYVNYNDVYFSIRIFTIIVLLYN